MYNKFDLLEVSGDALERGKQVGIAKASLIKDFYEIIYNSYHDTLSQDIKENKMTSLMEMNMLFSKKYCSELYWELVGISEKSGVNIDRIFFINSFLELVNLKFPTLQGELLGCTTFAANKETTVDNNSYIGQNFDMEQFYKDYAYIMLIKEENRTSLVFTFAGVLGCAGFNSHGIGVTINYLQARDISNGIIFPFTVRNILKQNIIGDAIGAATIGKRACGINYLIGDSSGNVFDIETSGKDFEIIYSSSGTMGHSNHFIDMSMKKLDMMVYDPSYSSSISRRGSTVVRYHTINKLLRDKKGEISLKYIKEITTNHINFPYSICRHGNIDDPENVRNLTVASLIFDLSNKVMYAAKGNSCNNDFYKYDLIV